MKHRTDDLEPVAQCDGQLDLEGLRTTAGPPEPELTIAPHFDGETYDPALDHDRRTRQVDRVRQALWDARRTGDVVAHTLGTSPEDYGWVTLGDLSALLGIPEASVSARLRDLRKPRFGGLQIDRQRAPGRGGLWLYRLAGEIRSSMAPVPPTQ